MNCNVFRPQTLNNVASLAGICVGVQRFFQARGLANSASVLTWDPKKSRVNNRRGLACPKGANDPCAATQVNLQTIGGTGVKVQCDEYPFAATEEGGDYFTRLATNPTNTGKD